jgi:cytochrome c oxidase subunit 4
MAKHIASIKLYLIIWAILLLLLGMTVLQASFDLHPFNLIIALAIAATKAFLVILFFMHVKWSSHVTWVFAGAAFVWLGIMLVLTTSDYATRGARPTERIAVPAVVSQQQISRAVPRQKLP